MALPCEACQTQCLPAGHTSHSVCVCSALLALPSPCVPGDVYTSAYRPDGQTCAAKLTTQSGKTNGTSEGPVIGETQVQGPPPLWARACAMQMHSSSAR